MIDLKEVSIFFANKCCDAHPGYLTSKMLNVQGQNKIKWNTYGEISNKS